MFMDEVEELLSLFWVMIPTQMKGPTTGALSLQVHRSRILVLKRTSPDSREQRPRHLTLPFVGEQCYVQQHWWVVWSPFPALCSALLSQHFLSMHEGLEWQLSEHQCNNQPVSPHHMFGSSFYTILVSQLFPNPDVASNTLQIVVDLHCMKNHHPDPHSLLTTRHEQISISCFTL